MSCYQERININSPWSSLNGKYTYCFTLHKRLWFSIKEIWGSFLFLTLWILTDSFIHFLSQLTSSRKEYKSVVSKGIRKKWNGEEWARWNDTNNRYSLLRCESGKIKRGTHVNGNGICLAACWCRKERMMGWKWDSRINIGIWALAGVFGSDIAIIKVN